MPLCILHIVRRYGPVGGMERYVWELTHALAAAGHEVRVLCAECCADPPEDIRVHELGMRISRPRWLGHVDFSRCVHAWLRTHAGMRMLVHSHERCADHHVTTFHSPPFACIREQPWWKRISPRARANLWLERREVCGPHVRAVVPNSAMTGTLLKDCYPCIGVRMTAPILPGVAKMKQRPTGPPPSNGGVIGFIGHEWKRKGLDIAVAIVAGLRRRRPGLEFIIAGPKPAEIRHLFNGWNDGFRLLGRTDSAALYPKLDLLLHPARQEPYGMAIAEAMAARVPVVISNACGIAPEISPERGDVLRCDADIPDWIHACDSRLRNADTPPGYTRSWQQVACEYEQIYRNLMASPNLP